MSTKPKNPAAPLPLRERPAVIATRATLTAATIAHDRLRAEERRLLNLVHAPESSWDVNVLFPDPAERARAVAALPQVQRDVMVAAAEQVEAQLAHVAAMDSEAAILEAERRAERQRLIRRAYELAEPWVEAVRRVEAFDDESHALGIGTGRFEPFWRNEFGRDDPRYFESLYNFRRRRDLGV